MGKFFKISSVILLAGLTSYAVYAEQVTMSTFYPSPRGQYITLSSTGDSTFATSTGKVRIGPNALLLTTTTWAQLDVRGDAHFGGSNWSGGVNADKLGSLWVVPNVGSPVSARLKFGTDGVQGRFFQIGTNTIPDIISVKGNGNVGIGGGAAADPAATLHVNGGVYLSQGGTAGLLQVTCSATSGPGNTPACYATPTYQT